jgi:hypothetical protein
MTPPTSPSWLSTSPEYPISTPHILSPLRILYFGEREREILESERKERGGEMRVCYRKF